MHRSIYTPASCIDIIVPLNRALSIVAFLSQCIDIIDFDLDLIDRYHRRGGVGRCAYWSTVLMHLYI